MTRRRLDPPVSLPQQPVDVAVIGAGFGGLGAALALAAQGARVALLERLRYPGGCASTFHKGGADFDAGATLIAGLAPHQLLGRWIAEHELPVRVSWPERVLELRCADWRLPIWRDRQRTLRELAALPGGPPLPRLQAFARAWRRLADPLWATLDDPELLPPLGLTALTRHALRLPGYLPLASVIGRPATRLLRRFGLEGNRPLRLLLDASCQITIQCPLARAETAFMAGACDYFWRGAGHIEGGVGELAWALAERVGQLGGLTAMATGVKALRPDDDGWQIETRRGTLRARAVVANLLPDALLSLLPEPCRARAIPRLTPAREAVSGSWGAAMHYLIARPPADAGPESGHLQLIGDAALPLQHGNHVFCSFSSEAERRAPAGYRALTLSTHVDLAAVGDDPAAGIAAIQRRMLETLARRAPGWAAGVDRSWPASPRTFARFVGRPLGRVGGPPRTRGLRAYVAALRQGPILRGLHLVGDSVFPGQSALAAATGGALAARRVLAEA